MFQYKFIGKMRLKMVDPKIGKDDDSSADTVQQVDRSLPDEFGYKEPQGSPVEGEEESVSEDTSDTKPADIDEELRKVGIAGANEQD